ncbi:dihydroorotate dehydrogenase electron transfer subunit [Pseudomonas sp. LRF_L74]|uniref:dihydroorotate dehydrogenase electron transfer subunit n=1 Tax=Pseudomonas sp. LRF_L74 TaxID=3369422 RepID=UPI003F62B0DE
MNAEYKHLIVKGNPAALKAQPGQFFHLMCPATEQDQPFLRRPMSLYGVDPHAGQVKFLYKVQGAGTRGLSTLVPGQYLDMLGPLGRGFELPARTRHVLLVARGVGLATLTPLADAAIAQGAKVTAILSARSPALIMSEAELTAAGAQVITVTDEAGSSSVPRLDSMIRQLHGQQPFDFMTTCGSNRLLKLLQHLSVELDVPGQIAMEQHMGCAVGMCYACVRPFRKPGGSGELSYRRVCWDGPVFALEEALTW